ncbi:MAG: hypothetical protein KC561_08205 [Myxococcales bacterium]|nr:hypothetical protein [Myxococcales bacterium]
MHRRISSRVYACLGGLALVFSAVPASAQDTISLARDFQTVTLSGESGGPVDASSYGMTPTGPCRGWISEQPNHQFTLDSEFQSLSVRVSVSDREDTSLVIIGNGETYCSDDAIGLDPAIVKSWIPGSYSVWVGSYSAPDTHSYDLTFVNRSGTAPEAAAVGLELEGRETLDHLGDMTLTRGFNPDPVVRSGSAEGNLDASTLANGFGGHCVGLVTARPNHLVTLSDSFSNLRVRVRAEEDTTLVVRDPSGVFWCNDDRYGDDPAMSGPWMAGTWRIWVGRLESGLPATYTIEFTERQ